jgi:hypothetical protein
MSNSVLRDKKAAKNGFNNCEPGHQKRQSLRGIAI